MATSIFLPLLHCLPARFDVQEDEDGSFVVTIPVAESVDGSRLVTVDTILLPVPMQSRTFELKFAITCTSLIQADEVFQVYDRHVAVPLIPDACRPYLMPSVCLAAQRLASEVQPLAMIRVTKVIRPVAKALRKHDLITQALQDIGYYVADSGTDDFKRQFWLMRR